MATMTILSILLAVAFTAIVIWKMKGLPESISAMVYALPDGGKGVLIAEVVCYVALVGALLCRSLVIPLG